MRPRAMYVGVPNSREVIIEADGAPTGGGPCLQGMIASMRVRLSVAFSRQHGPPPRQQSGTAPVAVTQRRPGPPNRAAYSQLPLNWCA